MTRPEWLNDHDLMNYCQDNGIPFIKHGGSLEPGRFASGWIVYSGEGRKWRNEYSWPQHQIDKGWLVQLEDGRKVTVTAEHRYRAGWKTFREAAEKAAQVGFPGPWKAMRGQYFAQNVWVPADTVIKGRKWWPPGEPCDIRTSRDMGRWTQFGWCTKPRKEGEELCGIHAAGKKRRDDNKAKWRAEVAGRDEKRKRDKELHAAASETCEEINALVAELLGIELDAKPTWSPAGHVVIDHETARRLVLNLVDRL